ncbi:MAG TPA: DUF6334 family protein [Asticcacaulis sp.]|nr:DUF6334 family protein [Asticcacaulis sp.]
MIREALDALDGQPLRILGKGKSANIDSSTDYEDIWLVGGNASVHLSVDMDTDEILIAVSNPPEDACAINELAEFSGKPFGWYWTCENSQGYQDMIIIAVDGIDPKFAFIAIASNIFIKKLMAL